MRSQCKIHNYWAKEDLAQGASITNIRERHMDMYVGDGVLGENSVLLVRVLNWILDALVTRKVLVLCITYSWRWRLLILEMELRGY